MNDNTVQQLCADIHGMKPPAGTDEPVWYCIAALRACAMACSNTGPWLPQLYASATKGLAPLERRKILRRILESLLEGSMLYGIPRMLNAFYPLAASVAQDEEMLQLEDGAPVLALRQLSTYENPLVHTERGLEYFKNIYRDDMARILAPMDRIAPDIRQYSVHFEYGAYLSENTILSPIETSQITLASLLPLDVPTQVQWHMRGTIRNNGTEEDIQYALEIARKVVDAAEVQLKHEIPSIEEVVNQEQLFL